MPPKARAGSWQRRGSISMTICCRAKRNSAWPLPFPFKRVEGKCAHVHFVQRDALLTCAQQRITTFSHRGTIGMRAARRALIIHAGQSGFSMRAFAFARETRLGGRAWLTVGRTDGRDEKDDLRLRSLLAPATAPPTESSSRRLPLQLAAGKVHLI